MPKPSNSKKLRSKRGGRAEGAVSRTARKPPAKTRTSHPLKKTGCTNGASRGPRPQTQNTGPGPRPSVQCCAGTRTHAGHIAHQLGHVVDVAEGALARGARGPGAAARAELRTHLNEFHAALDRSSPGQADDCLGVAVERELNHWEAQHAKVQETQQQASAKLHEARRDLSSVKAKHVHLAKALAEAEEARDRCRAELLSAQSKVREYKEWHDANRESWPELETVREELARAKQDLEATRARAASEVQALRRELERTREELVHACAPELTPDTIGTEAERVVRLALEDHAHIDAFAGLTLAILRRTERERDQLEQRLGSLESSLRVALEDHSDG